MAGLRHMLVDLGRQKDKLLEQVAEQSNPPMSLLEKCSNVARQEHALAHELFSITHEAKYHRTWHVDFLGAHGERLKRSRRAQKTPVETPWRELLEIVRDQQTLEGE